MAQPRSQGLSSLPPSVVGTETLVAAGHMTTQNVGGRKICGNGGATGFFIVTVTNLLRQMYLSTHPSCGFGWIDGHVASRNQGLCLEITPSLINSTEHQVQNNTIMVSFSESLLRMS